MHIASPTPANASAAPRTIALVGNPNVGKSTLFNGLTGMHQHTGNWAGKTVACAEGRCRTADAAYRLVDLPGTYSLTPRSAEEAVTRDYLLSGQPDAAVVVCDATSLARTLVLALQCRALCPRMLVCVNLLDEAKRKGIAPDLRALSDALDIPAIGISAHRKQDRQRVLCAIDALFTEHKPASPVVPSAVPEVTPALLQEAECIAAAALPQHAGTRKDNKLDILLTGRISGCAVMLLLLLLVLWLTIVGANYPSQLLSRAFSALEALLWRAAGRLSLPHALSGLLLSGVYRTAAWVVAAMLPPMLIFFPLFSLLEDAGLLPRFAFNLDRPFQRCRACGKQALTMCMGLGCNAVGVAGCRIIDSPRERLLAILTNSFMPCNGRFPTLITLLGLCGVSASSPQLSSAGEALLLAALILLAVGATFLATALLSATLLRGTPSAFVLELPSYRRPRVLRVIADSLRSRIFFVLGRAVLVAAPAGALLYLLGSVQIGGEALLALASRAMQPIGALLGMDGCILLAFLLGSAANEIVLPIAFMCYLQQSALTFSGALAGMQPVLQANGWTLCTVICMMLFTVMHWPCTTTLQTIYRETGRLRWVLVSILLPTLFGAAACLLTHALFAVLA